MHRTPSSRRWNWLFVILLIQVGPAGVPPANAEADSEARQILSEMLQLTEYTLRRIDELKSRGYNADHTFEESGHIANSYNQAILRLGERLDGLGAASRSFVETREGKQLMQQVNMEMKRVKQALLRINDPVEERDFGTFEISGEDKTKAKYEFIANYLRGVRVTDGSSTDELIRELNQTYLLARTGNARAKASIDETLELMLASYPKDRPEAQYNLGVLYSDLGETDESIRWFRKAAGQGFGPAAEKLTELNRK